MFFLSVVDEDDCLKSARATAWNFVLSHTPLNKKEGAGIQKKAITNLEQKKVFDCRIIDCRVIDFRFLFLTLKCPVIIFLSSSKITKKIIT